MVDRRKSIWQRLTTCGGLAVLLVVMGATAATNPFAPASPASVASAQEPAPGPTIAPTPDPISAPLTITVPDATGDAGAFITVNAITNGTNVRWFAKTPGLNVFPAEMLKTSLSTVVSAQRDGVYVLVGYTARSDMPSAPAFCTVTVGTPPPAPVVVVPVDPPVDPDPTETNVSLNRLTSLLRSNPSAAESMRAFYAVLAAEVRNDAAGGLKTIGDLRTWQVAKERATFANTPATKISGVAAAIGGFLDAELGLVDVRLDHAKAAAAFERLSAACGKAVR